MTHRAHQTPLPAGIAPPFPSPTHRSYHIARQHRVRLTSTQELIPAEDRAPPHWWSHQFSLRDLRLLLLQLLLLLLLPLLLRQGLRRHSHLLHLSAACTLTCRAPARCTPPASPAGLRPSAVPSSRRHYSSSKRRHTSASSGLCGDTALLLLLLLLLLCHFLLVFCQVPGHGCIHITRSNRLQLMALQTCVTATTTRLLQAWLLLLLLLLLKGKYEIWGGVRVARRVQQSCRMEGTIQLLLGLPIRRANEVT
jgi:hypothetical protein